MDIVKVTILRGIFGRLFMKIESSLTATSTYITGN